MRGKNLKPNDNSKNLLENFDLWEELEEQTGEKISGGGIFSFVNNTTLPIDVTLLNGSGSAILEEARIEPSRSFGTQSVSVPGFNQVTVEFDSDPRSSLVDLELENMTSNRRGIFSLVRGRIEFDLG